MMKRSGKWILFLGCTMIGLSLGLLVFLTVRTGNAGRENARIVSAMEAVLTDRTPGTQDPEMDAEMPALVLSGEDYIALLEIPAYGVKLPVASRWDRGAVQDHPCRFFGSVYDGSLVIGGSDRRGQFDFFDRVYDGTRITVTDMSGDSFSYTVDRVDRSKTGEAEKLMDGKFDLTLFVRDEHYMEYIILRCSQTGQG